MEVASGKNNKSKKVEVYRYLEYYTRLSFTLFNNYVEGNFARGNA